MDIAAGVGTHSTEYLSRRLEACADMRAGFKRAARARIIGAPPRRNGASEYRERVLQQIRDALQG